MIAYPHADAPTRVLVVGGDADLASSQITHWLPAGTSQVETAGNFLYAVERLLAEEWDVVMVHLVSGGGDADLRPWLEALEQARGRPRFIALIGDQPERQRAVSTLAEAEARHIAKILGETGGCIAEAARVLGIHRNTLARKVKLLGVRFRRAAAEAASKSHSLAAS